MANPALRKSGRSAREEGALGCRPLGGGEVRLDWHVMRPEHIQLTARPYAIGKTVAILVAMNFLYVRRFTCMEWS